MNLEQRMRFVVEFANADLDGYRKGDWMNLKEDLRVFLGFGGFTPKDMGGIIPRTVDSNGRFNEDEIRELREIARTVLGVVLNPRVSLQPQPLTGKSEMWIGEDRSSTLGIVGTPKEVLGSLLLHTLNRTPEGLKVLACSEHPKESPMHFFRTRRQKYCSRQCVDRANKRAQKDVSREQLDPVRPKARVRRKKKADASPKK